MPFTFIYQQNGQYKLYSTVYNPAPELLTKISVWTTFVHVYLLNNDRHTSL